MSEVIARVLANSSVEAAPASQKEIAEWEVFWSIECPQDLREFWTLYGRFKGFAGADLNGEYFELFTPRESWDLASLEAVRQSIPTELTIIGTNGSSEHIAYQPGIGFGLIQYVNTGIDDFMPVDSTLAGFFEKSEQMAWFPEEQQA
ncbi:SMI1/KNR4 family protein [Defluviimonas sp. WL0002]|uniref:SMI1/KNR4 family protein n=1 Tax=Albidovulum marisflavi TaxID=2984159 RepID=A0ABT2Z7K9_9RHOB|nr:SMI1/KNR4 family protein [Defluviimonas sp. WL0002]MCV2867129.1 SMI1/KNR4 family protein [Defluviimonas sp. WL0002]